MTTRPVLFPGLPVLMGLVLVLAVAWSWRHRRRHRLDPARGACCSVSACVAGVLLVLPVGGADVPIVISLLNAFTGLAVAASGLVLGNVLLSSPARSSVPAERS